MQKGEGGPAREKPKKMKAGKREERMKEGSERGWGGGEGEGETRLDRARLSKHLPLAVTPCRPFSIRIVFCCQIEA